MAGNSQKFIARNRAPRVQIEYDVELYGSQKKVQLPFVMGVMSDLSGKSRIEQPAVEDRKFLEIDADNFDDRMHAMQPRAAFSVPNTLTGDGNLEVDLTFEKMTDFEPGAIAAKIEPLKALLDARTQLSNLMAYMDGKAGAEALIEQILNNPAMLGAISDLPQSAADQDIALETLRNVVVDTAPDADQSDDVLSELKSAAPAEPELTETSHDVLETLRSDDSVPELDDTGATERALDALRAADPGVEEAPDNAVADALASLETPVPDTPSTADETADALDSLGPAPDDDVPDESADGVLADLATQAPQDVADEDDTDALLADLADLELPAAAPTDDVTEVLSGTSGADIPNDDQGEDGTDELLATLAANSTEVPENTGPDLSALDSLSEIDVAEPEPDTTDALLADISASAPQTPQETGPDLSALYSLTGIEPQKTETDTTDDLLSELANIASDPVSDTDTTDDLLADLAGMAVSETADSDDLSAALSSIEDVSTVSDLADDNSDKLLADLASAAPDMSDETGPDLSALDSLTNIETDEPEQNGTDELLADLSNMIEPDSVEPDTLATALNSLGDTGTVAEAAEDPTDDLLAELSALDMPDVADNDDPGDILADLTSQAPTDADDTDPTDDLLADLATSLPDVEDAVGSGVSVLDEPTATDTPDIATQSTEDLLADLADLTEAETTAADPVTEALDSLSDLVGDPEQTDAADDLLAELGEIDAPSSAQDEAGDDQIENTEISSQDAAADELDGLLDDLTSTPDSDGSDPLDDLLSETEASDLIVETDVDDDLSGLLDDLVSDGGADNDNDGALDDLLGDLGQDSETGQLADSDEKSGAVGMTGDPEFAFGLMSSDRPDAHQLQRKRFRIAIFGDFSGRAARGALETGDALAARRPILLDPDTVEDVISGFATTLVLPIGKDGAGVEVKLGDLDDLHPDELYENVSLFSELVGLRGQLGAGATADQAAARLREWSDKHGTYAAPTRAKSSGNAVPADLRLTDFQRLIGDTAGRMTQASPVEDLLARVVGPHIRAVPDADAIAMQGAVDEALSAAMRLILHHPEFQSLESQWRSIDLIARSVETDDTLDVILYDISAEEIAADLASADELSQSGLVRLLTEEPLDEENGRGGYSALLGLYSFEETPPHAELLGRIARVAAHVDAPFFSAMSTGFMETDKQDRHPLVAQAWDTLRTMPEAKHLGLVAPRFMLRRPYGAKTEPIYEFDFEEFTMKSGLGGMLWANPVVLVAILLAKSFKQNGAHMNLGSVMSMGDVPYHFVTDRFGDQVQLPCTERNLTQDKVEKVMARGFMPVVSVKGRDEIRLASFQAVGGGEILGPWSDVPLPDPSPPVPVAVQAGPTESTASDGVEDDLDALLAGFDDTGQANETSDGDIDADLAALLEDL